MVLRGRSHVVVSVTGKLVDIAANGSIRVPYTLPEALRPACLVSDSCTASLGGAVNLKVEQDGSITLSTTYNEKAYGYIFATATYPI